MSGSERMIFAEGVELHVKSDGRGAPVVLLHGFTGSTLSMGGIAAGLSDRYRVHRIDLIGHGASDAPHDVSRYRMGNCARQVAAVIETLEAFPAHVIGYSMGARLALALCAWRPDCVASAILIGARAGVSNPSIRAQRVRDDEALADRIEEGGVPAFVDHWMALPLFTSQRRLGKETLAAARRERLANRAHGLANSLRGMGVGAQPVLDAALPAIDIPISLVVGEEDARFAAVADALNEVLPRSEVIRIADAGHAAHIENAESFIANARRFIAENTGDRTTPPTEPESVSAPTP